MGHARGGIVTKKLNMKISEEDEKGHALLSRLSDTNKLCGLARSGLSC